MIAAADIEALVPDAWAIAYHRARHLPTHVRADDLASAAMLGLMLAARDFDPARGIRFGAYATLRMRGAVADELRATDHLPRRVRERVGPDDDAPAYLQAPLTLEWVNDETLERACPPVPSPEDAVIADETRREREALVAAMLDVLTPRQQRAVTARAAGRTQREVAAELGVTESAVSHLAGQARAKCRRMAAA